MNAYVKLALASLACAVLLTATGCPRPPENEVTWGIKAATGQLTETTATEWQAVAEKIDAAVPEADLTLSEEEAQAIVDFLFANELDSIEDIMALIEQVEADPASAEDIVIPQSLIDLFGDLGEDAAGDILEQLGA